MAADVGTDATTLTDTADDDTMFYSSSSSSGTLTDGDKISVQNTMKRLIVQYGYPLLRLSVALLVIYMASGVSSYVQE
jgi:hypothetical protein